MISPYISIVHPTCSPFAKNAALSLSEAGILCNVITTLGYTDQDNLFGLLPESLKQRLNKEITSRLWNFADSGTIVTYPWREILRLTLIKSGINSIFGCGPSVLVDWVYASLDNYVSRNCLEGIKAIYAYEDGAADTFRRSKDSGINCLYDLPIAYYKTAVKIQMEEAVLFPEFANSIKAINETSWKIERKEQELNLADHVFCASSFTKRSLLSEGVPADSITVIPYGAPSDYFVPKSKFDSKFRVIFVGRVSPRKGVHYLIDAWHSLKLKDAELLLIGVDEYPQGWLRKKCNSSIQYVGHVSHDNLKIYYNSSDLLVLPSLVEGFGLVLLESMASGVPVIATPNTAGPEIINNGVNGFIVPTRSVEALKEKIEWCYENPGELTEMKKQSRKTAEYYSWDKYRKELSGKIIQLLNN